MFCKHLLTFRMPSKDILSFVMKVDRAVQWPVQPFCSWHIVYQDFLVNPKVAKFLIFWPVLNLPKSTLSSLRAKSARAVTGRRCPHSGRGEDFLSRQPDFFYENCCNSGTVSRKIFPKVGNESSKGYKWAVDQIRVVWQKLDFLATPSAIFGTPRSLK